MIKKITEIEKTVTVVRLNDDSEYDPERCHTGGAYGFWTDYNRMEDGRWYVSYGTTADFEFCPVCGSFNDHYCDDDDEAFGHDSGYSCGEYEVITTAELIEIINSFVEDEDHYITYKSADEKSEEEEEEEEE